MNKTTTAQEPGCDTLSHHHYLKDSILEQLELSWFFLRKSLLVTNNWWWRLMFSGEVFTCSWCPWERFHNQFKAVEDFDAVKEVWKTEMSILAAPSAYVSYYINSFVSSVKYGYWREYGVYFINHQDLQVTWYRKLSVRFCQLKMQPDNNCHTGIKGR